MRLLSVANAPRNQVYANLDVMFFLWVCAIKVFRRIRVRTFFLLIDSTKFCDPWKLLIWDVIKVNDHFLDNVPKFSIIGLLIEFVRVGLFKQWRDDLGLRTNRAVEFGWLTLDLFLNLVAVRRINNRLVHFVVSIQTEDHIIHYLNDIISSAQAMTSEEIGTSKYEITIEILLFHGQVFNSSVFVEVIVGASFPKIYKVYRFLSLLNLQNVFHAYFVDEPAVSINLLNTVRLIAGVLR